MAQARKGKSRKAKSGFENCKKTLFLLSSSGGENIIGLKRGKGDEQIRVYSVKTGETLIRKLR